ncbi:MAG: hypothetical protein AVDCRST_MAG02-3555, partial [uncultured Rubrobacteraceae bacterium]
GLAPRAGRRVLDLRGGPGRVLHGAPLRRLRVPQHPSVPQALRRLAHRHPPAAARAPRPRALDGRPAHDAGHDNGLDLPRLARLRPDPPLRHEERGLPAGRGTPGTVPGGGLLLQRDRHLHPGLRRHHPDGRALPGPGRLRGACRLRVL